MEVQVVPEKLGEVLGQILLTVHRYVSQHNGHVTGMPFLRYLGMDGQFTIEAGMPVAERMVGTDEFLSRGLPAGKAATTLFLGEYHRVGEAWER